MTGPPQHGAYRAQFARQLPALGEVLVALQQHTGRCRTGAELGEHVQDRPGHGVRMAVVPYAVPLHTARDMDIGDGFHRKLVERDRRVLAPVDMVGMEVGDVDERATRWLAQLLDMGTTRVTLRRALLELAAAWEETHPRAADQVRRWSEAPVPSDPTQDLPWMQALLPLARARV